MGKKIINLTQVAKVYSWFLWGVLTLFSGIVYAEEETLPKPIFKLTKGQGTEVCKAYLQRLNATEFVDNDPVRGRISEPLLYGFIDLKPVPLTAEEIQRINYKISGFIRFQDQTIFNFPKEELGNLKHYNLKTYESLIRDLKLTDNTLEGINKAIIENKKTPFVRYQVKLNLDNKGESDDIVIKNNEGVYIVDKQLQSINIDKMKSIFANQDALEWPTLHQFPSLAFPITVFGYKNKYYFSGFYNNLILSESIYPVSIASHRKLPYLFGIFINEKQQTQRICEYEWININHALVR